LNAARVFHGRCKSIALNPDLITSFLRLGLKMKRDFRFFKKMLRRKRAVASTSLAVCLRHGLEPPNDELTGKAIALSG